MTDVTPRTPSGKPSYDRDLLLRGAKGNAVLDLWEVHRYGTGVRMRIVGKCVGSARDVGIEPTDFGRSAALPNRQ